MGLQDHSFELLASHRCWPPSECSGSGTKSLAMKSNCSPTTSWTFSWVLGAATSHAFSSSGSTITRRPRRRAGSRPSRINRLTAATEVPSASATCWGRQTKGSRLLSLSISLLHLRIHAGLDHVVQGGVALY